MDAHKDGNVSSHRIVILSIGLYFAKVTMKHEKTCNALVLVPKPAKRQSSVNLRDRIETENEDLTRARNRQGSDGLH
ncbi:hypothetical protein Trydic_g4621 [Trypoxylus dichotomus]